MNFVIAAKSPPTTPRPPILHTHILHVFNQVTFGPIAGALAARKLTFVCVRRPSGAILERLIRI